MPEVNMDSAKLAEIALSLCSSAPHDFGGIVFKNASETHTSHIRSLFKSGEINATVLQPFYLFLLLKIRHLLIVRCL